MDFYDELYAAVARDGAKRGIRTTPEEFQKFLSNIVPEAAAPQVSQPPPPPAQVQVEPVPVAPVPVVEDVPVAPPAAHCPAAALPDDWAALRAMALSCQNCALCSQRQNVVFGEGNIQARLMFIGEGPGADEDATGRPFVGAAGQLLDKMIAAMHLAREDVYIANIVKCRPPGNRMPGADEAAACIGYLKKQIQLIQPEVIVLLGGTALSFLLEINGITKYRGRWQNYNNIAVMPTFHPAFLLRKPEAKREAWHDLKLVMAKLGIAV